MTDDLERRVDACETNNAVLKQGFLDIKDHLDRQDKLLWFIISTGIGALVTWIVFHF